MFGIRYEAPTGSESFGFWAASSTTSLDWVILGHQPAYFVGFGDLTAQLRRCPTNLLGPAITSFFLFNGALNRPKHIFGVQQKMNRLPRICLESSMAHGLIWPFGPAKTIFVMISWTDRNDFLRLNHKRIVCHGSALNQADDPQKPSGAKTNI